METAYRRLALWLGICLALLAALLNARAEDFSDISVDPNAIYTGNTFHGYAEMRVNLENHSHTKSHVVTLVYPNQSYGNFNTSIGRLSRAITLPPEARQVVSLLQPPLPINGDSLIRVDVDGQTQGETRAPNANSHCNTSREWQMNTILDSRSLDFDAFEHLFATGSSQFTAAMAVGEPDTKTPTDPVNSWMPDRRQWRRRQWLELDYAKAQIVDKIVIQSPHSFPLTGLVEFISPSATNVIAVPFSSGARMLTSFGQATEISIPSTSVPVKTVRLTFDEKMTPYQIAIDAVQISGPSGAQWAATARASSDNSSSVRYGRGMAVEAATSLRAESPVSDWSENWLAYTPFDAVVFDSADLGAMSPGALDALGAYVSAGGIIILPGASSLPPSWHPTQKTNLADGVENNIGFGHCFTLTTEHPAALDPKTVQTLRAAVSEGARYWQTLPREPGAANELLTIVQSVKIPTRGIIVIMLCFIIVIGPVNIVYLTRRRRRTWLLWTIPAISLLTTVLVFAYSLLREGITPSARISGVTLLDQAEHRATTLGGSAYYCPLTPGGGLHFEYQTEVTPLAVDNDNSGNSRQVDWTQSQQFPRGWVSARVPAYFHVRKSETRRERIQMINENGTLQIVNGLGAPIKDLWLADGSMNYYHVAKVAAGQKGALLSSRPNITAGKLGVTGLLSQLGFAARQEFLSDGAEKYLLPNTYVAVLEGNPFIENALGSASGSKQTKSWAVVFGILEPPETR